MKIIKSRSVLISCFMETHIYGEDPSKQPCCDGYYWIPGPEFLPDPDDVTATPRRGLGMLIDNRLAGGARVECGKHTFWVRFPSGGLAPPLFVCCLHVHVARQPELRLEAFAEMAAGLVKYKKLGITILCGDFNSRCALNGDPVLDWTGQQLITLAEDYGLSIVNSLVGRCSGQFTRVQRRERLFSAEDKTTIDYALIDSRHEQLVTSLSILGDLGLHSDHRVCLLDLYWDVCFSKLSPPPLLRKVTKIAGCSKYLADGFEKVLSAALVRHCAKRRQPANSTQASIDLRVHDLVELLKATAARHFGTKLVGPSSRDWFSPQVRILHNIKCQARKVLRAALKFGSAVAVAAAEAAFRKSKNLLRSCIKTNRKLCERQSCTVIEQALCQPMVFSAKWKGRVAAMSSSAIPDAVLNRQGNVITGDPLAVLKVWKDYTARLGEEPPLRTEEGISQDPLSEFEDVFARKVLASLRESLTDNRSFPELDRAITWIEVHNTIRKLAGGKSPGPDGVGTELLRLAGLGFEAILAQLFNDCWSSLVWPSQWQLANLIPLYKNDGNSLDPNNHRMLALMNALPKVFEKILDARLREWAERVGCLSDMQGGFRSKRGTIDQCFILSELISYRTERGLPTFAAFIDIAKAYDRVWRNGLWVKLQDAGCDVQTLLLIQLMYRNVTRRVLLNGKASDEFVVHAGVPQGAVLSPLLYAVYINGLHQELRANGVGIWFHGRLVPLLLYADDIVLLADSEVMLQVALRVVEKYAGKWRFTTNHSKSNVIVFGSKVAQMSARQREWLLCGARLKVTDDYKYLGLDLSTGGHRGRWNAHLSRLLTKGRKALNLLVFQGGGANGVRPRAMVHLWASRCRPKLEYACELWEGECSKAMVKRFESLQSLFLRSTLGTRSFPAAVATRADTGVGSCASRRQLLKMLYWSKLCNANNERLLAHVFRHRHAEVLAGGARFSCLLSFRQVLSTYGLTSFWESCSDSSEWPTLVRKQVLAVELGRHHAEVSELPSLSFFSTLHHDFSDGVHPYLDDRANLLGTRLKSKLRWGCLWLMQRVASNLSWPVSGGMCPLCRSGEIEDASHFLLSCPALRPHHEAFMAVLASSLALAGLAGQSLLGTFQAAVTSDKVLALRMLAGDVLVPPCPAGVDGDFHHAQCCRAAWILDKVSKDLLVRCWKARMNLVGSIKVSHSGSLVHIPPVKLHTLRAPALFSTQVTMPSRSDLLKWCPRSCGVLDVRRGSPSGFYAVTCGRSLGVFDRWCDAHASVAGHPGGKVKGFDDLDEARGALVFGQ